MSTVHGGLMVRMLRCGTDLDFPHCRLHRIAAEQRPLPICRRDGLIGLSQAALCGPQAPGTILPPIRPGKAAHDRCRWRADYEPLSTPLRPPCKRKCVENDMKRQPLLILAMVSPRARDNATSIGEFLFPGSLLPG